jgi:hypothetical protein
MFFEKMRWGMSWPFIDFELRLSILWILSKSCTGLRVGGGDGMAGLKTRAGGGGRMVGVRWQT